MTEEVPTFVVVNITTSRRGLELMERALEYYYKRHWDDREKADEIKDILDGLKGA